MKTAKKIIALALALSTFALILTACGAKPPEQEATTGTEIHSFLDKFGVGAATTEAGKEENGKTGEAKESGTEGQSAENKETADGSQAEKTSAEAPEGKAEDSSARIADVEFILKSYYTDGENYGEIKNIRFDDEAFASSAYGYFDVTMTYVKNRSKNLVIYYRAYNEKGAVVRNSATVVKMDKVRSGDTVEHIRFNVPFNTVKVEFLNADEAKK